MGFKFEFNTIVKENDPERLADLLGRLEAGEDVEWSKAEARIYPLDVPVDVTDAAFRVVGRVEVVELSIRKDSTRLLLRAWRGA